MAPKIYKATTTRVLQIFLNSILKFNSTEMVVNLQIKMNLMLSLVTFLILVCGSVVVAKSFFPKSQGLSKLGIPSLSSLGKDLKDRNVTDTLHYINKKAKEVEHGLKAFLINNYEFV